MKVRLILFISLLYTLTNFAQEVSNLNIIEENKEIKFSFFFSPEVNKANADYSLLIEYSEDGGESFSGIAKSLSSSFGSLESGIPRILPAKTNIVHWDVFEDVLQSFSGDNIVFRIKVFESNIVFGDKPSISTLVLPTNLRSNKSMKLTNMFYALAIASGIAFANSSFWYNKYLNADSNDDISRLYNYANNSNKAGIIGLGLGGFIFSYNLGRLASNKTKYASLRSKF